MTEVRATTPERRSTLGYIALATTAISAIGLAILLIGDLAGVEGANEGEEGRAIFDIAWVAFFFCGIAALVSGLVAFFLGTRRGDRRTRRDGSIALAYCALALVLAVLATAFGD